MPGRVRTIRVTDSEKDFNTLAHEELLRLQRQYRLMELDRHALSEESGSKGNRQKRILHVLEHEKKELLTDLRNALSIENQGIDKATIKIILKIIEKFNSHRQNLEIQLNSICEMQEQVDKITRRVIQQKLKVQALFGQSMTLGQAEKRQRALENRLYHVTTLFDTRVTCNKNIRVQINDKLIERARFHEQYETIKKNVGRMRKCMAELVDTAMSTYDQREEAAAKIRALRDRNEKESKQHILEMKEFQRILHHDEKSRRFIKAKGKHRKVLEEDEDRQQRLDHFMEKQLDELIHVYKLSFRELLHLASARDVDALLNSYLTQEQTNFARFKYISDLNNEVEALEDSVLDLKKQIEDQASKQKIRRHAHLKILKDYDFQLKEATTEMEKLGNQWEVAETNMEKVISELEKAFNGAKCGNAAIVQLLGNQSGLSPRNACFALNVLEHRITELQFEKGILEIRKAVELEGSQLPPVNKGNLWLGGQKPKPNGGPFKPKILVTGRFEGALGGGDDDDEMDESMSQRPIFYDEMRASIILKMKELMGMDVDGGASKISILSVTG